MRLKLMIFILVAVVLGYSLFWHYMAYTIDNRLQHFINEQAQEGGRISYERFDISGFPYRMDMAMAGLTVTGSGPDKTPISFTAPMITATAFPWKMTHIIVHSTFNNLQIGPGRNPQFVLNMGKTRASVILTLPSPRLVRMSLIADMVNWQNAPEKPDSRGSAARTVKIHLRLPPPTSQPMSQAASVPDDSALGLPLQARLYVEAVDVMAEDIPVALFGKKADRLILDLALHGQTIPRYDRESLAQWRDTGGTIKVRNLDINTGKMNFELSGDLALDQDMKPLGAFSSTIHGINHMIDVLARQAPFQKEPGVTILREMKKMSKVEKNGSHQGQAAFDIAISFQAGMVFLGPIPIYALSPLIPPLPVP